MPRTIDCNSSTDRSSAPASPKYIEIHMPTTARTRPISWKTPNTSRSRTISPNSRKMVEMRQYALLQKTPKNGERLSCIVVNGDQLTIGPGWKGVNACQLHTQNDLSEVHARLHDAMRLGGLI